MEIIQVEDVDLKIIEANRCRTFRTVSQPLTAQRIWDDIYQKKRQRVIVICNTVSQAQGIYRDLETLNQDFEIEVALLHARFLPEHRAAKESYLKDIFAQNWRENNFAENDTCQVLISTQVIEAGINITCEVLHTQLSPMNSLLQRGGRCARFPGEIGEVFIYRTVEVNRENRDLAETDLFEVEESQIIETEAINIDAIEEVETKKESFLPYKKEICELTWQVLEAHTNSERASKHVGFRIEEEWINRVHQDEDLLALKRRENSEMEFENNFHDAVFKGDESKAIELIRKVDNRSVFTWTESSFFDDDDDEIIDIQKLLPFSVPISTLCKAWRDFQESLGFGDDWIFQRIETPKYKSQSYSLPALSPITSRDFLIGCYRIFVNPRYIYYDESIGLRIGIEIEGNNFKSPPKQDRNIINQYCYRMDNYVGHLVLMWKVWREDFCSILLKNGESVKVKYTAIRNELLVAGSKFIQSKVLPNLSSNEAESLFEVLVFFAIFTHDLGKLQSKWQEIMRGWQKIAHVKYGGKNPRSYLLAHTDYNPDEPEQKNELKAYEKKNKRPNHAVESAFLAQAILKQSLVPLLRQYTSDTEKIKYICYTVMMAAGRHHSAWSEGFQSKDVAKLKQIELCAGYEKAIADSWRCMVRFLPNGDRLPEPSLRKSVYNLKEFDLNKFDRDEIEFLQIYSLVVRALRLCDQR
ncbi:CRISPR-associated helicase Cas3 [Scytonema sp. UIC 10036]|uniref:helicase-related protein n=1 Tax=Scytonema sp. UIC 10036 TaxID=2304196 RepID=UPI0012DA7CA9|nr:helicase-related protein [Scytonema sp. UIC 10036]MUH01328.1 CRISPR-associated helicase Cas3 [Scytonema sp. UIC 10036]